MWSERRSGSKRWRNADRQAHPSSIAARALHSQSSFWRHDALALNRGGERAPSRRADIALRVLFILLFIPTRATSR